ncbi:MAG: hypothetical protein IJL48_06750 [Bacteroidales bacterium]|nr:hypothetical protein [Bacteroidales bacterium]
MKKVTIFCILFICSIQISTFCQVLTPAQLKSGRNAVYDWISAYNTYANCDGNRAAEYFKSLFQSDTTKIYNDYYPMKAYDFQNPTINVYNYVALIRDEHSFYQMRYSIHDARIVKESYKDSMVFFNVTFIKDVSFYQKNNYRDDRYEYPVRSLNIEALLVYRVLDKTMYAMSLECHDKIDPFAIIHEGNSCSYTKKSILQHTCTVNSTPLLKHSVYSIPEDNNMYEFKVDTIKHYVGLSYGIGYEFVNAPITDSRFKEYVITGGLQNDVMLKYYQQLFFSKGKRLGIEVGLSHHWSTVTSYSEYYEQYNSIDPDGSPYNRIIESENYYEHISQNVVSAPITLKYEYFFNNQISLFGQTGIDISYNMMNTNAGGDLFYKGYYEWLYNVLFDQNGIYDFGKYDIGDATTSRRTNSFSVGGDASIGGCYYLSGRWMIQAAIRYRAAFWNDTHKASVYNLSNHNGDWMPLINIQNSYRLSDISFLLQINYNF